MRQLLIVAPTKTAHEVIEYLETKDDSTVVSNIPLKPDPKKYSFTQFFVLGGKVANTSWTLEKIRTKLLPDLSKEEQVDVEAFLEDSTLGSYIPIQNESSYLIRVDL